jgi:hypothetical protein
MRSTGTLYHFRLDQVSHVDRNRLEGFGFALENLEANFQRAAQDSSNPLGCFSRFDQGIIQSGAAGGCCPTCGAWSESKTCFPVMTDDGTCFMYRFHCHMEFYVMRHCYWQDPAAVYIPISNVVAHYCGIPEELAMSESEYSNVLAQAIKGLRKFFVYRHDLIEEYINKCATNCSVIPIIGLLSSISHHIKNELSGLDVIRNVKPDIILESLLIGPHDHFDTAGLFPDAKPVRLQQGDIPRTGLSLFDICTTCGSLPLHVYAHRVIPEALCQDIHKTSLQKCSGNFIHRSKAALSGRYPVLWITLRSSRTWITEEDGLPKVLNALFKDYPDLAVLFDGTPKETDKLREIVDQLTPQIPYMNLLSATKFETIALVHLADLWCASGGSGMGFTNVANLPGVYHTNISIAQWHFWPIEGALCVIDPREKGRPLLWVPAQAEVDLGHIHCRDYDLDWLDLLKGLRYMLQEIDRVRDMSASYEPHTFYTGEHNPGHIEQIRSFFSSMGE